MSKMQKDWSNEHQTLTAMDVIIIIIIIILFTDWLHFKYFIGLTGVSLLVMLIIINND